MGGVWSLGDEEGPQVSVPIPDFSLSPQVTWGSGPPDQSELQVATTLLLDPQVLTVASPAPSWEQGPRGCPPGKPACRPVCMQWKGQSAPQRLLQGSLSPTATPPGRRLEVASPEAAGTPDVS